MINIISWIKDLFSSKYFIYILIALLIALNFIFYFLYRGAESKKIAYENNIEVYNSGIQHTMTSDSIDKATVESLKLSVSNLKDLLIDTTSFWRSGYYTLLKRLKDEGIKNKDIIDAQTATIQSNNELIGQLNLDNGIRAPTDAKSYTFKDGYLNATLTELNDSLKLNYTFTDVVILYKSLVRPVRENGKPYFWLIRWLHKKVQKYSIESLNKNAKVLNFSVIELK